MALQVKNSTKLLDPTTYKMKTLVVAMPGAGKTTWAATAPNPGFAVCETGWGKGLLSVAYQGVDYVEPSSIQDFDTLCAGQVFKEKDTIILDSLTDMCKTFVKDHALSFPRNNGNTPKRQSGVPELDDFGVMGELTRKYVRKLLDIDKHIICTALLRIKEPDKEQVGSELLIGPDLPGQMFLGSVAMFDTVLVLKTRHSIKNPEEAKRNPRAAIREIQRYFVTQTQGPILAKNRITLGTKQTAPLLDQEEVFDLETGQGTFSYLLEKIRKRLTEYAQIKAQTA